MKRFLVLVAFLGPLVVSGCGQPQLVVEAALTDGAGERLALGDLAFRLLPYDRDAIFDSLEAAYPEPEPPIPPDIIEARQRVQDAQTAWRAAEERWATIRDSLRILGAELEQMRARAQQGTPQYQQGFLRWNNLEAQERQINQQRTAAFATFDQLQQQTQLRADSIRIQQELWADQAFADFNRVVAAKLDQAGREELADTTNSQGYAQLSVREGRWWLYSRYTLPYEELYWNLPLDISGDTVHVSLNRENAQVRPIL